jgi:MFS family permease
MYSFDWSRIFLRPARPGDAPIGDQDKQLPATRIWTNYRSWLPTVSGTVLALGWTSLLTDISSEMVASILPVYLVLQLRMGPLAFGVVDGLYQGSAALVRIAGGLLADRWRRYKEMAAIGYGLSAVCRLLIPAAGSTWGMIAAVVALDRIGKGIRTAPRDALISHRSSGPALATAFGVHRAMDAVGAMLGPVFAFLVLETMSGDFNVLFVASFGMAVIGLGAILCFVPRQVPGEKVGAETPVSPMTALRLLGEVRFRALVFAAMLLGLTTISDSFIYLILQQRFEVGLSTFPLLYVGTSLFTAAAAIPCGRLADRFGRTRMLLSGYGFLALAYVPLLLPAQGGFLLLPSVMVLLGIYYAATDGVLTAMAAAALPASHAASGLALLVSVANLARLAASVIFGFLWASHGSTPATLCYLTALLAAMATVIPVLTRTQSHGR